MNSVNDTPTYWPLGGELGDDIAYIMVERRGQNRTDTLSDFQKLMEQNNIVLVEGCVVQVADYVKFEQVMQENGWKKEFIVFGP